MSPVKKDPVPVQQEGRQSDIIENRFFSTTEQADKAFQLSGQRLYDINNWGNITKGISADFTLTDKRGNRLERKPEDGDYIRIDLPGPGSIAGHGYDWVQIETVEESLLPNQENRISITVRPAEDPGLPEGSAHFFDSGATSTFLLIKKDNQLSMAVHGRNETPATAEKLLDTVRNNVVSEAAALGAAEIQWKKLCKAIIGI